MSTSCTITCVTFSSSICMLIIILMIRPLNMHKEPLTETAVFKQTKAGLFYLWFNGYLKNLIVNIM